MADNFSFLFGFITSIGFYRLFYSMNRPETKKRSIALLLICVLVIPVLYLWKDIFMGYNLLPVYASLLTMIYGLLALLAIVLLGTHRRRAIVCAVFIFAVINMAEIPIVFFIGIIARPSLNMLHFMEELFQIPGVYLLCIFIVNTIITGYCFLAAHWLRKTQLNPPRNLVILFSLIFFVIPVIIFIWFRVSLTIMSASFFSYILPAILLMVLLLVIFYIFTQIMAKKEIIEPNGEELPYAKFVGQLSKRELEVIEAILTGYTSQKELAAELTISVNTIKTHLKRIYQTTGVSSVDALSLLFQGYTPNHP